MRKANARKKAERRILNRQKKLLKRKSKTDPRIDSAKQKSNERRLLYIIEQLRIARG